MPANINTQAIADGYCMVNIMNIMKIFCDDIGVLLLNQTFSDRLICIFLSDTMAKDDVTVIDNIHSYN